MYYTCLFDDLFSVKNERRINSFFLIYKFSCSSYVVIFLICIFLAAEGLGYQINQEVGTRSENDITPTAKWKRISLFHINRSQHINCWLVFFKVYSFFWHLQCLFETSLTRIGDYHATTASILNSFYPRIFMSVSYEFLIGLRFSLICMIHILISVVSYKVPCFSYSFLSHGLEDVLIWAPTDFHHHIALFLLKNESARVEPSRDY